jgi:hypothetical protein
MPTFTVFALYEDNMQPFATSVECEDAQDAPELAQQQADESNLSGLNEEQDGRGPDDAPKLIGFQVIAGSHEVLA